MESGVGTGHNLFLYSDAYGACGCCRNVCRVLCREAFCFRAVCRALVFVVVWGFRLLRLIGHITPKCRDVCLVLCADFCPYCDDCSRFAICSALIFSGAVS